MKPDFENMNVKALKQYANDNNIDLGDAKKKADIVNILESKFMNNNEEDVQMEENTNLMENEMEVNKEVDTNVPESNETAGAAADKKVWHNAKGDEVSMSEFIREQFTVNNLSRKEISEKFDINYRTVYGATVNMTNDAEPSSRGRGVTNPKIKVTADNKVLIEKTEGEGDAAVTKYFLNGEELIAGEGGVVELPETVETDRNSWIKDQVAAGVSRGDIAKILDISYGVVYGMTKEEEGTRQKYEVEYEENGETKHMARTEYIRKRVAEGVSRADVAKELGVEYSVVWQATKKDKTDEEKYEGLIEQLEKMADKINDKENFIATIEILKGFAVVEETKDNADSTEETKVEGAEA